MHGLAPSTVNRNSQGLFSTTEPASWLTLFPFLLFMGDKQPYCSCSKLFLACTLSYLHPSRPCSQMNFIIYCFLTALVYSSPCLHILSLAHCFGLRSSLFHSRCSACSADSMSFDSYLVKAVFNKFRKGVCYSQGVLKSKDNF